MPRTRPPYSPEFRQQMVELVRAGRTPGELSREFEPTAQTILNWVKRSDVDAGIRSDGLTTEEREEVPALQSLSRRAALWRVAGADRARKAWTGAGGPRMRSM